MEGIVVASCSLSELLAGTAITASDGSQIQGRLKLPEYQRPYRWSEKELNRLVEDLSDYFQSGGEARTGHDFYLGSIILHQTHKDEEPLLNIIDGQQRLTSMAMLAYCWNRKNESLQPLPESELQYSAPESQDTICRNLQWLAQRSLPELDFEQVNITLVVTHSEDDAYRFFETQNTGGVRLSGPDIIKAHHLRAVPRIQQNDYARLWEGMDDLSPLVDLLMKGRYWQTLRFRNMASHRNLTQKRTNIVAELAEQTARSKVDVAYRKVQFQHDPGGWSQTLLAEGYALRQPLNEGVNTIQYLRYFHQLRKQVLEDQSEMGLNHFYDTYNQLAIKANGSPYLKKLYDSTLLLYISQFGLEQLHEASLWLFRVVFSKRLSNEKTVREDTVQSFVKGTPVLDWIATSFSHSQLMEYLRTFSYSVDNSYLDKKSSIKRRFVSVVSEALVFDLPEDAAVLAARYDQQLKDAVELKVKAATQGEV